MTWPIAAFGVSLVVVAGVLLFVIIASSVAISGFRLWLDQRERERLSGTDKAELMAKFEETHAQIRDLKGAISNKR